MNFLDLFAGIGGFALGAEWAGLRFDRHYYSEIDAYAQRVYQLRFPGAIALGDIRGIRGADLPEGEWIIAGGFPCQDISVAGKGAGLAGERSGLWFEYARIIGELRPRFALMENVGALAFRGLDSVLGSLATLGYDAEWQDIRASDVGAPHRRERLWIIAYPNSGRLEGERKRGLFDGDRQAFGDDVDGCNCALPDPEGKRRREGWAGRPLGDSEGEAEQAHRALADAGRRGLTSRRAGRQSGADREMRSRGEADKPSGGGENGVRTFARWWAVEPDVGRVASRVPARVDRLRCLGNSIVPQIAEMIFRQAAFDEWRSA